MFRATKVKCVFLTIVPLLSDCGQQKFGEGQAVIEHEADILNNAHVFKTSQMQNASLNYQPDSNLLEHNFELYKANDRSFEIKQLSRDLKEYHKKQGQKGETLSETISLKQDGPLDIVIVIDNSNTMQNYQDRLSEIEPLLSKIGNADWQIGVVTTDSPCLRPSGKPITRSEYLKDPTETLKVFSEAVRAGTHGHPVERGIEMAIRGMKGECRNITQPWVRSNSKRAVLVVSDEENCGSAVNEKGCQNDPESPEVFVHYTPDDYIRELGASTKFYGILHHDDLCGEDYYDVDPLEYLELVERTGGMWGAICEDNYGPILTDISHDVGQITLSTIELKFPIDTHLPFQVKVDGTTISNNMLSVDGKFLIIDSDIINDAREIHIEYTHGSAERFAHIDVIDPIDPASLRIMMDTRQLHPSEYAVTNNARTIHFHTTIPEGSTVDVEYLPAGVLEKEFEIPSGIHAHQVKINGIPSKSFAIKGNRLIFDQAPVDASQIDIKFNFLSEITTTYPFYTSTTDSYIEHSQLFDRQTDTTLWHRIQNQAVEVDVSDVREGRTVKLEYRIYKIEDYFELLLPHEIINESITISHENCSVQLGSGSPSQLVVTCKDGVPVAFDVNYSHFSAIQNIFELEANASQHRWRVWVDGHRIDDFYIEDKYLHIPREKLGVDSVVWALKDN